jgi:hypothetical protein
MLPILTIVFDKLRNLVPRDKRKSRYLLNNYFIEKMPVGDLFVDFS